MPPQASIASSPRNLQFNKSLSPISFTLPAHELNFVLFHLQFQLSGEVAEHFRNPCFQQWITTTRADRCYPLRPRFPSIWLRKFNAPRMRKATRRINPCTATVRPSIPSACTFKLTCILERFTWWIVEGCSRSFGHIRIFHEWGGFSDFKGPFQKKTTFWWNGDPFGSRKQSFT